ncbi:MAG: MFS transporter [Tannerellaceae bacterium]|nr:MFS transporter [Tannerellaceae bacterium]
MNNQNNLFKVLPVFMAFYVMGFPDIVGVATSYVRLEFGLTNAHTHLLTIMAFVWFALLSVPVGIFQDKYSKKRTVNLGIIFIAMGMVTPLISYSFQGMITSFTCMGIGNAIIQVSANPLMQDVSPSGKLSRNLTLSQFVKAIAGMGGPFIATFFAEYFNNWTIVYWVYLTLSIITIIWLQCTPIRETGNSGRAGFSSTIKLLSDRKVLLLVCGTFLMVGFDVGMNTNIPDYLKSFFGVSQEESNRGISLYFAALMTGRFVSALILNKMKSNKMLLYCAFLSILTFASMYRMDSFLGGCISVFSIGLCTAAIFPLIFSAGLQYLPERANELSGLMIMSVCGGGVIPPLMALITDSYGLMTGMLVMGACLLYILYLAIYLIRSNKSNPTQS